MKGFLLGCSTRDPVVSALACIGRATSVYSYWTPAPGLDSEGVRR